MRLGTILFLVLGGASCTNTERAISTQDQNASSSRAVKAFYKFARSLPQETEHDKKEYFWHIDTYMEDLIEREQLEVARAIVVDPTPVICEAALKVLCISGHAEEGWPALVTLVKVKGPTAADKWYVFNPREMSRNEYAHSLRLLAATTRHLLAHLGGYAVPERKRVEHFLLTITGVAHELSGGSQASRPTTFSASAAERSIKEFDRLSKLNE